MLKNISKNVTTTDRSHGVVLVTGAYGWIWLFVALSWLLVSSVPVAGVESCTPCPPRGCQCSQWGNGGCKVECRTLSNIPDPSTMPPSSSVLYLKLSYCNLAVLTANVFRNYTSITHLDVIESFVFSLEEEIFKPLTNLQSLNLQGNKISILPANIFAGQRNLKTLILKRNTITTLPQFCFSGLIALETIDLQNTGLTALDKNSFQTNTNLKEIIIDENPLVSVPELLFRGLNKLESLKLSYSKLTSLPKGIFKDLSSLTKIKLGGNPWSCDCMLGWIKTWSNEGKRKQGLTITDENSIKCTTPDQLVGRVVMSLRDQEFSCVPKNYASCFLDEKVNRTKLILYRSIKTASSRAACSDLCYKTRYGYAALFGDVCLCGQSSDTPASCSCSSLHSGEEPQHGSKFCQRKYIRNAYVVYPNLRLTDVHVFSTNLTAVVTVACDVEVRRYTWRFGDSSNAFRTSVATISHSYSLPGDYTLTVSVLTKIQKTETIVFSIHVIDPVLQPHLSVLPTTSLTFPVQAELTIYGGSETTIVWSRTDSSSQQVQDHRVCHHGGKRHGNHCYVISNDTVSWNMAVGKCYSLRGQLAVIDSEDKHHFIRNHISSQRESRYQYWIGLSDQRLDNTFLWSSGFSVGPYSRWCSMHPTSNPGLRDCVCMTQQFGDYCWQDMLCNPAKHYICQYDINTAVDNVQVFLAGVGMFSSLVHTSTYITASQDSQLNIQTKLVLIPGMWFQQKGHIQSWRFVSPAGASGSLRLQVYRPICSKGQYLIPPGCNSNPSPYAVCATSKVTCSNEKPLDCPAKLQYCPLNHKCLRIHNPCNCNILPSMCGPVSTSKRRKRSSSFVHLENTLDLESFPDFVNASDSSFAQSRFSAKYFEAKEIQDANLYTLNNGPESVHARHKRSAYRFQNNAPVYKLVSSTKVDLSTSTETMFHVYADLGQVQVNDIIGFEHSQNQDVVKCSSSKTSVWRQNAMMFDLKNSVKVGDLSSGFGVAYSWTDDLMCEIKAIYGKPVILTAPPQLVSSDTLSQGTYTYKVKLRNSVSSVTLRKEVFVEKPIKDIILLSPEMSNKTGSSQNSLGTVGVEVGKEVTFLILVSGGLPATTSWSFINKTNEEKTLSGTCPLAYSQLPKCTLPGLTDKFAVAKYTFSTVEKMELNISAHGKINEVNLIVDIDAQETISGLGIMMDKSDVYVDEEVTFTAGVLKGTAVSFFWTVSNGAENWTDRNKFKHRFASKGIYNVTVHASNMVSSKTVSRNITVSEKTHPHNLQIIAPSIVAFGDAVTFSLSFATLGHTDLNLTCHFGDGNSFSTVNLDSSKTTIKTDIKHTYKTAGSFSVNFILSDKQDFANRTWVIVVKKKITSLTLSAKPRNAALNTKVRLFVTLEGDARDLMYTWNFGDGSLPLETKDQNVTKIYTQPQQYRVTVQSSNGISQASDSIVINVDKPIRGLTFTYDGPTKLGTKTLFRTDVTSGTSITYEFDAGDASPMTEGSNNSFSHTYQNAGSYTATVKAKNAITTKSETVLVHVMDVTTLSIVNLIGKTAISTGKSSTYRVDIVNYDPTRLQYEWTVCDGQAKTGRGLSIVSFIINETYDVCYVQITISDGSKNVSATKDVSVQTEVENLTVQSNSPVTFSQGQVSRVHLQMSMTAGSNLRYIWYTDNSTVVTSTPNHTIEFTSPGEYEVSAKARNRVSSHTVKTSVFVQVPIRGLQINTPVSGIYVCTGVVQNFTTSVSQGTSVQYKWDMGDSGQAVDGTQDKSYAYSSAGQFTVKVQALNLVSKIEATCLVNVEEPVSGLTLTSSATEIEPGVSLSLTASITTGSRVKYRWKLCSSCSEIESSQKHLSHVFNAIGEYTVFVTCYNHINEEDAYLVIYVTSIIKGLNVSNSLIDGKYAVIGRKHHFEATIQEGARVHYSWVATRMLTGVDVFRGSGTEVDILFEDVGQHTVIVTVSNSISQVSDTVTVDVYKEVSNLKLSAERYIQTGVTPQITATYDSGNNVILRWRLEVDGTFQDIPIKNSEIELKLNNTGMYNILAIASNVISSQTANITIIVQDPVEGIVISYPDKGCVELLHNVTFSASLKKGSDPAYQWTVSAAKMPQSSSTIHHVFTDVGVHKISVSVSNQVSKMDNTVSVVVQEKIKDLRINMLADEVEFGKNVKFEVALSAGSDYTFDWDFGDGTTIKTTDLVIYHQFSHPGIVVVSLTAHNRLGTERCNATMKILKPVLDVAIVNCCKMFVPVNSIKILEAKSQTGSFVQYHWMISYSGNETTIKADQLSYVFKSVGKYTIKVKASNSISEVTSVPFIVKAQSKVQDVGINSDIDLNFAYSNQNITFSARPYGGSDLNFDWFDNYTKQHQTGKEEIVFRAESSGVYFIQIKVYNKISTVNKTIVFTIQDVNCEKPKLTVIGGHNHEVLRSRSLIIEVVVDLHGCTKYEVTHQWRISKAPGCGNSGDEIQLPDTVNSKSPMLVLPPLSLDYGVYCVAFSSEYKGTPVISKVAVNVKVLQSPLIAVILGGNEREVWVNSEVILNGSLSYDPDSNQHNKQDPVLSPDSTRHSSDDSKQSGLSFLWQCTSVSWKRIEYDPQTQGCFNKLSGQIIKIPRNTLIAGRRYTFTLTVFAPGRTNASSVQEVIVENDQIPEVTIQCLSCSATNSFSISRSQHIKLVGNCPNCMKLLHFKITYQWVVTMANGTRIHLRYGDTTTGTNKPNLVIKRGVLSDHIANVFTLYVNSHHLNRSSYASLKLMANPTPSGGVCTASPSAAVVMEEPIRVNCTGWRNAETITDPLMYIVQIEQWNEVQGDTEVYTLYHGTQSLVEVFLSPWPNNLESDDVRLVVFVSDHKMASTVGLNKTITLIPPVLRPGQSKSQYLSEKAANLSILQRQSDMAALLQYATVLSMQLNRESAKSPESEVKLRGDTRKYITMVLNNSVEIHSLDDVQQVSFVLKQITAFPAEFQSGHSQYAVLNKMVSNVQLVQLAATQGLNSDDFSTRQLLATVTNLINAANLKIYSRNHTSQSPILDDIDYLISSEVHRQEIVNNSLILADKIMTASLRTHVVGEKPESVDFEGFSSQGLRLFATEIRQKQVLNDCEFHLSASLLWHLGIEEVFQIMQVLSPNPYTWGYANDKAITSRVAGLTFKFTNGTSIHVADLKPKSTIHIVMSRSTNEIGDNSDDGEVYVRKRRSILLKEESKVRKEVFYKNFTLHGAESKLLAVNTTNTVAHAALHIRILTAANMTNVTQSSASSVSTKSNVRLTAFLGKGRIPTEESHDDKLEITSETTALDLPVYNYTFFVNESDFHQGREYFILLINRNGVHNVDVSVGSYYSTCQYYSESREKWDFTGCFVDPVSEPARSMCFCNHLTSFGATVIFPVNDIDFRDLAKLDFSQNPVAIVTCSVIFGLYIIFMVVAVRWDRKSLSDISVVPLCGKDADYKYELTVITGRQRGAGTTANVGINLYGEYGKSGPCHLYKPGAFKRNSQDVLLIATDKNLGSLWKLHLWHDNSGLSAAWYVNHVIIRDLQTNQKYCFIVESWLTLKYEKCSIEKDIFAAGEEELQKFSWLFRTEASRGFAERHMWLSVWERPARSRFTCAQRVTCCVTLLYTYMAVNAMWYGAIKQTTLSDAVVSFDSVFSWEEIFVGIVSSFMVFPINLGIVAIFRRSRWRKTEGIKKPGTAQTIEIDCEISRPGSCADSYFAGTDFIVPYERESTADTISVHAGKLKRTGNLRISKEDASDEIQKDISESSNGSSDKKLQNVVSKTAASHMWWSYDSILNWPEHLPSWTDGQESRQNSASFHNRNNQASKLLKAEVGRASNQTNSQKGGIPKGEVKKSIMKRAPTRRFSLTDSIDAILEDEAFWSCNQSESSWTSCDNRSKDSDSIQDVAVDQSNTQQPNTNKPDEKDSNINNTENSTTDVKKEGGTKRSGLFRFSFRNPFSILLEKAQNLLRRRKNKIGDQVLQKNDLSVPAHTESTGENAESIPMETLNTTHSRPLSAENFNPRADPLLGTAIGGHAVLHSETAVNNIRDCTTADDANSQLQYTAGWSPQYSRRCSSVSWKRQLPVLAPVSSPTQQVMLPHWCIYLAYFLCFILSSFSVILVMLYVYRFGRVRALKWLAALIISFFQSFLIIEPLKVVFFAVFLAAVTKRFDSDNSQDLSTEILPVVEYNEKIKDVKMKPIGGYALLQAREEGRKVRRMHLLIRHTLVYVFYFWLIIIMNYASHDNKQFLMSARVKDVFVEDVFPGKDNYNFLSIISTSGYWTWLETVAAQGLHKHQLENHTTLGLPLGVARLRQVRSKTVKCPAESVMTSFGVSWITACGCYGDPGHVEDTSSYFEGWKPGVFPNATWFHQESALTNSYGEQGKVAWYSGGGYVQLLGSSYTETIDTIQKLKQQNWIDRGTRAVFLEWTLYNGNVNLYTVMTLLAEFPLSGGVLTSHSVRTIQRFELVYYTVDMLLVCKVLMGLVVCYLMVHCFLSFQQQRWHYLVSLWNLMELSVTVVSLTTMVIYIHNLVQDSEVFYQYLHNKTGFTSFIWSSYWYTVWKRLMASLLFLLMLLIVKQLRFIKPLSVFGKTLKYASSKLLGCVLIFLLLILTYSQLGSLVYGSIVMELQSVGWAFVTMVGIIRGDTSVIFDETLTVNKTFTILFFGTFLCAIFVVVMGLIIAVLCDAYKMIKCQMYYHNTLEVQDYEVIEFMMKRFKLWARIDKPKPAFRKVKFQGMPSVSSRTYSSQSSRTVHSMASSEHMTMDSLEDNTSQYMEQLLVQVVPRWEDMIAKLDQVVALEEEQQIIDKKINKLAKEMVLAKCQQQKKRASSTSQIVDQSDSRTVRSWSRSSSLVTSSSLVNERKNSKTNTQSQVTAATNARVSSDLENSSKWAVSRTDNPNSSVSAHRDRICTKLTAQMRRNSDVGKTMSSMNAMESKPPIASQSRNARITASRRNSVTAATPSDPIDITYNALKPFSDQSFRPPDVTSENYLPKPAKPAW